MVDKLQKHNIKGKNITISSKNSLEEKYKYLDEKYVELKNKIINNNNIYNLNKDFTIMTPKYIKVKGKDYFMGARLEFNIIQKEKQKEIKQKNNKKKELNENLIKTNDYDDFDYNDNEIFEINNKHQDEDNNNILKEDIFENNNNVNDDNIFKVTGENTKIIIIQPNEPPLLKKKRGLFTITNAFLKKKYKKIF